jgi:site-specific DNA recombinase
MQQALPLRFVGYVRVSTDEQARSGLSIQAQRERLVAWAAAFGHSLVEVVADEGVSAKSLYRPGMTRIMQMIDRKQVDGVVAAKLDRLTRSTRDLADLVDRCERREVALASVSESLDTSTACGRMVVSMLGVVAQWEREATAERTAAALDAKRRQRRRYCGKAPLGFRFEDDRLVENADEQALLDDVESIMQTGDAASLRTIGRMLGQRGALNRSGRPFSASSVRRLVEAVGVRRRDRGVA